jgi:CRISPR-associated protein Cas2
MLVLVTYDVRTAEPGGAARLRRVAKVCRDYGQRVQFSVFEIEVDPAQWAKLRAKLENLINPEHDSLRYLLSWGKLAAACRACGRQAGRRPRRSADCLIPARRSEPQACLISQTGSRSAEAIQIIRQFPANPASDVSSALSELLIRAEGMDFLGQRRR